MNWLRIINLKSITDSNRIPIKPITLLVGKNGSGKSSFARVLPLLKQSIKAPTKGAMLWYGQYVDYGSFHDALQNNAKESEIAFELCFSAQTKYHIEKQIDGDTIIKFSLKYDEKLELTFINSLVVTEGNDTIELHIKSDRNISAFYVNNLDMTEVGDYSIPSHGRIIPLLQEGKSAKSDIHQTYYYPHTIEKQITNFYKKRLYDKYQCNMSKPNIKKIFNNANISNQEAFDTSLSTYLEYSKVLHEHSDIILKESVLIRNLTIAERANKTLMYCQDYIDGALSNSHYVGPIRANAQRYYREQEIAVDAVDPRGDNLAMFIRSLSLQQRTSLNNFISDIFNFTIKPKQSGGHVSILITRTDEDSEYNMADVGFGYSQLLPVIAQLWSITERTRPRHYFRYHDSNTIILVAEQPELHLHPEHQAKLADIFSKSIDRANSNGLDLRLLVETHSESLVNRVGSLIAADTLKTNDAAVVLFDDIGKGHIEIKQTTYDKEGILINWPYGFFVPSEA